MDFIVCLAGGRRPSGRVFPCTRKGRGFSQSFFQKVAELRQRCLYFFGIGRIVYPRHQLVIKIGRFDCYLFTRQADTSVPVHRSDDPRQLFEQVRIERPGWHLRRIGEHFSFASYEPMEAYAEVLVILSQGNRIWRILSALVASQGGFAQA